jgi:hypothetical protein
VKAYLKLVFSSSPDASFSRLGTAFSLLFSLGWVTYLVIVNRVLPDLHGIAFLNGSIYAIGKVNETIQKFSGGNGS